jgi:monoamine oxidase
MNRNDRPNSKAKPVKTLDSKAGERSIRRRDFLNGLLIGASGILLGGASAGCSDDGTKTTPNPPPPPPAETKFKGDAFDICHSMRDGKMFTLPAAAGEPLDCVIIGGGISGLVAARRLQRSGVTNFLLLEKEDPVGGVSKAGGSPDRTHAQAAAYTVLPYNDNLNETYEDLGVITGYEMGSGLPIIDPKYIIKPPTNGDWIDGQWYEDAWEAGMDALPYPQNVIDDLKAFREDMIAWYNYVGKDKKFGFDTPTDASTADPEVRALDGVTLAEYVASKGWAPEVSVFFDRYVRSALGTTHDKVSAWAAIGFLGAEFSPVLSQPGGNAWIALKFADLIGADKIKTGAIVLRAKNEGDEVHVSYMIDGEITTVRAKTAIYAANRYMAKYVLPDLGAAGRDEAKDFHYTPYIVAAVYVDKTPPNLGYDNWVHGEFFFTDFIVADWAGLADPGTAPLDRPNVLSAYCPLIGPDRRAELLVKPFEEYEEAILADLEKVLPGVRETVTGVDIYRWGHAMLATDKGFVFGPARTSAKVPLGKISFACHDSDGLPAFENAVGAAYTATTEVAAVLGVVL